MLLRLNQNQARTDCIFDALIDSITHTIVREIRVGTQSKHSKNFNFPKFQRFVDTVYKCLEENKDWKINGLEEFLVNFEFYAERQARFGDFLIFWTAHAKLKRMLQKKVEKLMKLTSSANTKGLKSKVE